MSISANIAGEGGSTLPTGGVPGAVEPVLRAERSFPGPAVLIRSDFEDRRGAIRASPSPNRRKSHETKKPIFTICHGVQILIAVDGVVRGKKVGALAACEPEVTLAGGTYIDLSPTDAYVDGTMVSAKGWTALAAFIRECLKVLGTEIRHA